MPLHQYDYLFAIGTIFAALDAFNIGANDVANSFATSVSSRSLTLKQAVGIASVCEFAGAVLVGARVAETIRNGIIDISIFHGNPGLLLLAMVCAVTASATWLTIATRLSMPVSTTHSIIGALAGVGVSARGMNAIKWGWTNKGMTFIFGAWVVAPAVAGIFASIIFLITKYTVLLRKSPVKVGLVVSPVYFFAIASILTMVIIWKGAPALKIDELPIPQFIAAVLGTGSVISLLAITFWLPFVYCRVVRGDHTLRWYMIFLGPLVLRRPIPLDANPDAAVPDYYRGYDDHSATLPSNHAMENIEHGHGLSTETSYRTQQTAEKRNEGVQCPSTNGHEVGDVRHVSGLRRREHGQQTDQESEHTGTVRTSGEYEGEQSAWDAYGVREIEGAWAEPENLWIIFRYNAIPWIKRTLTYGTTVDVVELQRVGTSARRVRAMHQRVPRYDNKVEHLYSFLQVLTAATASFAHGSNDVSNAIGPFATIYFTWHTGSFTGSQSPVAVWQLALGGAMIVFGLATYGYNIMRVLGNRLTPHSPSRGMSMELGAALAVITASQLAIPISTTQCIVGATLGVGLCNGDLGALNWRMLAFIWFSWIITIPVVGILAGCMFGIIVHAPRF